MTLFLVLYFVRIYLSHSGVYLTISAVSGRVNLDYFYPGKFDLFARVTGYSGGQKILLFGSTIAAM